MADYVPKTTLEHLEELEAAISALRSGHQAYTTPDGATYTKATYSSLVKEHSYWRTRYDEEIGASPVLKTASFTGMSYE